MWARRFGSKMAWLGITALLCISEARTGEKKEAKRIPGVEVKLRFSVDELDPAKPGDSFVECTLINQSTKALEVPVGYATGFDAAVSLHAEAYWDLRMVMWGEPIRQQTKRVESGEKIVVFKDELKKVFLLDMTKEQPLKVKERRYVWSWIA